MHFKVCSAYIFYRTFLETTLSVLKCTVFAVEGIQSIRYTTIRNALRISCATRSNFTVGHSIQSIRYTTIRNALRISCATRSNFTVGHSIQSIRYTTIRNALRISCATRSNFTVGHSIPIVAINYRHSWTVSLGTVVMIIVGRCSINFG